MTLPVNSGEKQDRSEKLHHPLCSLPPCAATILITKGKTSSRFDHLDANIIRRLLHSAVRRNQLGDSRRDERAQMQSIEGSYRDGSKAEVSQ